MATKEHKEQKIAFRGLLLFVLFRVLLWPSTFGEVAVGLGIPPFEFREFNQSQYGFPRMLDPALDGRQGPEVQEAFWQIHRGRPEIMAGR